MRQIVVVGSLVICLTLASCTNRTRPVTIKNKVPVSKVKGIVTVNGEPTVGVVVACFPNGPIAEKRDQYISNFYVMTNDKGEFALRTYDKDDGLPKGKYDVTFKWWPTTDRELEREGENDRLDGKYDDRRKPFKTIEVEEGKPLDLGTIDLKANLPKKK